VRPVPVVVERVLGHDPAQVPLPEDQNPVSPFVTGTTGTVVDPGLPAASSRSKMALTPRRPAPDEVAERDGASARRASFAEAVTDRGAVLS
jgi:hypothetical protein